MRVSRGSRPSGKDLVLFFYPKDDTPGCTAEACGFRDAHQSFVDAGCTVVGVSSDSAESHAAFAARHRLPYTLLTDSGAKLRGAFKVPSADPFGLIPGRVTFVISKEGKLLHSFTSLLDATAHVREAMEALKKAGSAV